MPDQVPDMSEQYSCQQTFFFKFEKGYRDLELLSCVGFLPIKAYLTKNPSLNVRF